MEEGGPRMVLVVAGTREAVFSSSRKMYESCCRGFASVRLMATEEFSLPLNLSPRSLALPCMYKRTSPYTHPYTSVYKHTVSDFNDGHINSKVKPPDLLQSIKKSESAFVHFQKYIYYPLKTLKNRVKKKDSFCLQIILRLRSFDSGDHNALSIFG